MGKVNFPYLSRSFPDHPLSGGWWLLDAFPGLELALALKGVDNEMRSRFLRIRPELMERMELCCYPRLIDVECAQKLVLAKLEAIAGCHEEDGLPIEPCTGS